MQKRVPENEFLEEVINIERDLSELIENRTYCVPVKKKRGNFIKVVLVVIQLFVSMTRSRIGSLSVLVDVLGLWVSWQQSGRALWRGEFGFWHHCGSQAWLSLGLLFNR